MAQTNHMGWWILGHYQHEPLLLYRFVCIGLLLTITGFASAAGSWLWVSKQKLATWPEGSRCACQLQRRAEKKNEIDSQLEYSGKRITAIQLALQDQTSPFFAVAREQIQKEEEVTSKLKEVQSADKIESLQHFSIGLLALLMPTVGLSVLAGRLMIAHFRSANICQPGEGSLTNWHRPYWVLVLLPFVVNEFREIKTSVWDIDKSWFGWSSFCVCPLAWLLLGVMALGVLMVIAYPATIMWCLSRTSRRPSRLDADANDGAWGVGSYILFLQTWSIAIITFFLTPAVIWLKVVASSSRFSLVYLATGAVLFLLALVLDGRLIWNAVLIRLLYQKELRGLGSTWSSIQERKVPGDPTTSLLGERWWSLPATIFGTLAVLWAIVQWSGVDVLLKRLLFGPTP